MSKELPLSVKIAAAISIPLAIACGGKTEKADQVLITPQPSATASVGVVETKTASIESDIAPKSKEEILAKFASQVLKSDVLKKFPSQLNLQPYENPRNRNEYKQEFVINGRLVTLTLAEGFDRQIQSYSILITTEKQEKDGIEGSLPLFDEWFLMPQNGSWNVKQGGTGVQTFEKIVSDNRPGSFESRLGYTVSYKDPQKGVTIAVGATKIFPTSPGFSKFTGLE
ncbi:MAG TPA: hypothetical protein VIK81_02915 [Patescibacteria group bacterium]